VNWEDECEEEEGLVVRELRRRMAAEMWLIEEEVLVNERRATRRESTTFAWGSKHRIAPKQSQIQLFSSYCDMAHQVPADHLSKQ
jgi:hypothetical protein